MATLSPKAARRVTASWQMSPAAEGATGTRRAPDPLPPEREEPSRERERLKEPLPLSEWELLSPGLPPPELCCEPPDEADLSEE